MPSAPDIQQPPSLRQQLRGMFHVRRAPPGRWRFALRASLCMGVPVLAGWLAGDVASGMMAATGGFTALYGSDRPYLNRARELAAIALAFALAAGLGMAAAAQGAVAVVLVVALIAMVATWMGNAFQIGPPGAYMFLLACAAASGMRAPPGGPLHSALLVLAGGGFAWCVHMLGALFDPRGPEKAAALRPGALSRTVVLRVGLAALLAGWLGAQFELERSYWAVAAAVLMLHQGFDWNRTLVRSAERLLGTWVGLLLGGAIIVLHPQGLWLALTVMALQFVVEMLVVRNYAMAVVFITSAALLLASGAHPVEAPGAYVLARGVDTAVGCMVALLVFHLVPSRPTAQLPPLLAGTLRRVDTVVAHLARGELETVAARAAHRDLQRHSFVLEDAYESAMAASAVQRGIAERQGPAVATTLQVESGGPPADPGPLPPLLERELRSLYDCLSEPARQASG